MPQPAPVAYVLKCYPRLSETFIVNEILAHEAAGLPIEIFSLHPPEDGPLQEAVARVQASVRYITAKGVKAAELWKTLQETGRLFPHTWETLRNADDNVRRVYQALRLACEVQRLGIRHLHAHFATGATSVARLAADIAGISYSFTAHANDIFHESVQDAELEQKLADAGAVITVSDFNLRDLRDRFGPATARLRRIYNGLDLERFPYRAPAEREQRIVAVGRLVEKKGFADLVDACEILAQRRVDFRCAILGSGPLLEELRARVRGLRLEERVELPGPLPLARVVEHVQRAAALAAPCVVGADGNRDGLPTVLLEAMALGTPCVSTDVTGIPEALRDGETGIAVPQGDATALADALERLLSDSLLRVRLARAARSLIESRFDIHSNAARIRDAFDSALRGEREVAEAQP